MARPKAAVKAGVNQRLFARVRKMEQQRIRKQRERANDGPAGPVFATVAAEAEEQ